MWTDRQSVSRAIRSRISAACASTSRSGADNPVAAYFVSLSIGCLLAMLGCLGMIAYFLYLVH